MGAELKFSILGPLKVDNPYLFTFLISTPIFEWQGLDVPPRMDTKETCVENRLECML